MLTLCATAGHFCPGGLAQSGSPAAYSTARALCSSGLVATSPAGIVIEGSVGAVGPSGSSESLTSRFEAGVVGTEATLLNGFPVLFGVAEGRGSKDGGETVTLVGSGLQSSADPIVEVRIGGLPASGLQIVDDGRATVVTPAGVDGFQNPRAAVDIELVTQSGAVRGSTDAFIYTPALMSNAPVAIDSSYELELLTPTGALAQCYYGFSIPSVGLPVAPFDGAAVLLALFVETGPAFTTTSPTSTLDLLMPNTPNLIGLTLEFQAFALTSFAPLGGSFTNLLPLTIGA